MRRDRYAPAREHGTGNQMQSNRDSKEAELNYGQKSNGFRSAKYRTSCAGNKLRHELDARNSRTEPQPEQGRSSGEGSLRGNEKARRPGGNLPSYEASFWATFVRLRARPRA